MPKTKRAEAYSHAVRVASTGRAYVDVGVLLKQGSVKKTIEGLRSDTKPAFRKTAPQK